MLGVLRWLGAALVPALLLVWGIYRSDKNREPIWLVSLTFALGAVLAAISFVIETKAAQVSGLDLRAAVAGEAGAVVFIVALVAPVNEAAKVAAAWPAFRSRHFDEPYDGLVYSAAAALGFAAAQNAAILRAHPTGWVWLARAGLSLPAHLFFASAWGYALGRAKRLKTPGALFPLTWFVATMAHALYAHFVYGRGPGALVAVAPLLAIMGGITFLFARDLRSRGDGDAPPSSRVSRLSRLTVEGLSRPPSLTAVRDALRRADHPIMLRWIVMGALVTVGAMVAGLAASVAFGNWAHVDFAVVDEHDASTVGPVALLGAGVLAAFPLSGFLVAKASSLPTLLEPTLASALAILLALVMLGFAAPLALVFALAFSPVAWILACAGAWIGRPSR
ncbi:MAG TPA: PrsW family glutamic-type intramembrane protease [Polyangiaceae bacterium]